MEYLMFIIQKLQCFTTLSDNHKNYKVE